jgi:hypothetical protein
MGQQQVTIRTLESESLIYSQELIDQVEKKDLWECYRLGNDYCPEDIEHASMMTWILGSSNKEIKEQFDNIIKGVVEEDCKYKKEKGCSYYNQPDDLYQMWIKRGNRGTRSDFLDALLEDDNWDIVNNW